MAGTGVSAQGYFRAISFYQSHGKMYWWLLIFTVPLSSVASAGVCVWAQTLTEATRGKKTFWEQLAVLWSQATSFFAVLSECRWCSSSGRLSLPDQCLCQVSGQLFHTSVISAFQRVKLKMQLMASALCLCPSPRPEWCVYKQCAPGNRGNLDVNIAVALGFLTRKQVELPKQVSWPQVLCHHLILASSSAWNMQEIITYARCCYVCILPNMHYIIT